MGIVGRQVPEIMQNGQKLPCGTTMHLKMEAIQLVATQMAYCRHFLLHLAKVAPSPVARWYLHRLIQYHGVDNLHEP